jgi:hypothetical protein
MIDEGKGILTFSLLQVITPIVLLSVISTFATISLILIVVYLIRSSGFMQGVEEYQTKIPSDSSELFMLLKDWGIDEYKALLLSFLLHDECVVLEVLLSSLREDGFSVSSDVETIRLIGDGGWRNRNQIASRTGLSKRRAYGRNGVIDRLVELGLVEQRESPKPWGHQTYQYRANTAHPLVRSMFHSLNGE